jgi:glycosyltransferase involved in cell wall biosynthesis
MEEVQAVAGLVGALRPLEKTAGIGASMVRKLLLIGALPPPIGGDAIWAQNFVNHPLTQDISIQTVNTSLIGRRAQRLGSRFHVWDEIRRACGIWGMTLSHLIRFKPEVAHLNCNCAPMGVIRDFVTLCCVRVWGVPVVLHCHANVPDAIGASRLGAAFLRCCLRLATRVLVLNAPSANYCNQLGGITCDIMPNFINEDEMAVVHAIRPEIANVVFVGHMIRTKGVLEMVGVAKRFPRMAFVMAGMVTPEIFDVDMPVNMKFMGNVDKSRLQGILDNADVFMFPTYTEGFSLALLEAMARGLPVVTTPVGANGDMIESQGGVLVPVGEIDALCRALQQMQDPAVRASMSQWNISKVKNNYTAHKVIQSLKALYVAVQ